MRRRALSSVRLLMFAGAAFAAATSSGWAENPGGKRLIRQGYYTDFFNNYYRQLNYNPRAYQPRYLFYPSRGGGNPSYNSRPYYGGHFHAHTTETKEAEQPQPPKDTRAHIHVRVPAGAELWFNGKKVSGEETGHKFVSPSLTPGRRFFYEVRVQWQKNGRTVTETREIAVKAGAHIDVDFTKSTGMEK